MKLVLASACAAACLLNIAASANPRPTTVSSDADKLVRSTPVRFTDLDLASPADRTRLDHRLRAAAMDVCRIPRSDGSVARPSSAECYGRALREARVQVQSISTMKAQASGSSVLASSPTR